MLCRLPLQRKKNIKKELYRVCISKPGTYVVLKKKDAKRRVRNVLSILGKKENTKKLCFKRNQGLVLRMRTSIFFTQQCMVIRGLHSSRRLRVTAPYERSASNGCFVMPNLTPCNKRLFLIGSFYNEQFDPEPVSDNAHRVGDSMC